MPAGATRLRRHVFRADRSRLFSTFRSRGFAVLALGCSQHAALNFQARRFALVFAHQAARAVAFQLHELIAVNRQVEFDTARRAPVAQHQRHQHQRQSRRRHKGDHQPENQAAPSLLSLANIIAAHALHLVALVFTERRRGTLRTAFAAPDNEEPKAAGDGN